MKRLTTLLINDSFPPLIDGVANTTFNYASIIQENYGKAIVATPTYPTAVDDYPFEVCRFPSLPTENMIGYRAGMPFRMKYLANLYEKNIDIIHTHCPFASTLLARTVREAAKKPVILTYHTKFDIDIRKAVDNRLLQDAAIKLIINNISSCDEVWTVSKGAGENLRSLGYQGEYLIMPNGVDMDRYNPTEEHIKMIKEKYHLPLDKPIYLFVGRMMWYKGLRIILDALKIAKEHGVDFRMVFVGGGTDFEDVKEYCHQLQLDNWVIFTGRINERNELKDIYAMADMFLFPSTYDTNGIVVREAAANCLGTILVRDSCAAEDTSENENVLLMEENADSLAQILIQNGQNVDYYHQIGKNAQQQLYLSWQDAVEMAYNRYVEILETYDYNKTKKSSLVDPLFNFIGESAVGLSKTKDVGRYLSSQSEEYNALLKETVSNYQDKTQQSLREFFQKTYPEWFPKTGNNEEKKDE